MSGFARSQPDVPRPALDGPSLARQPAPRARVRHWRPWATVAGLWGLFGARPLALLAGLVASFARAALLLGVSLAVGRLVAGDAGPASWAAAVAGLAGAALFGHLGQRAVVEAVQEGLGRLRLRLLDIQWAQPGASAGEGQAQALVLALTRDGELLGQMARACFASLLPAALLALLCLAGIAWTLPALAPLLALGLLALAGLRRGLARRLADDAARAHAGIDALYGHLSGVVARHELTVSHGLEPKEREQAAVAVQRAHARTADLACSQSWAAEADTLGLGLALLGMLAALALAGSGVLPSQLAVVAFLLLVLRSALQTLLRAQQEVALGVPALAEIEALLALPGAAEHTGREAPSAWAMQLRGVGCRVGGHTVLRHVDLDLTPGRITVLTGANGAGKTTLLRLLLGLVPAHRGELRVDGRPWHEVDRAAFRRGVGYLPQDGGVFAGSVRDNVAYAAPVPAEARALQLLGQLGLEVALDLPLGADGRPLSGGERQRLALARVLTREPRLLVMDEPTNHLDAASVPALLALLRSLPVPPVVLIVSHDPAVIAAADDVVELVEGVLTRPGGPARVD